MQSLLFIVRKKRNARHQARYKVRLLRIFLSSRPAGGLRIRIEFRERGSHRRANVNAFLIAWYTPYSILDGSRGEKNSRNFIVSLTAERCRRVKMRRFDPRGRALEKTHSPRRSFSALCLPTLQSRPRNECTPRARNSSRIITHPFLMVSCALPCAAVCPMFSLGFAFRNISVAILKFAMPKLLHRTSTNAVAKYRR